MKKIKNLLFDLDGTLYPYSSGTQDLFEEKVILFFQKKYNLSAKEAVEESNRFMERYHNSLGGFEEFPDAEKKEFMDFICDIDVSMLKPNLQLAEQLKKLPQRKIIVTDSTVKHVRETLGQMQMGESIFSDIFDTERSRFVFKPHPQVLMNIAHTCGISLAESAFFEDKIKNLEAAKKLGMTTIWITETSQENPSYVDFQFTDVLTALRFLFS